MSAFLTIFFSVFLAELGDKTQLATVLFASDGERSKLLVFVAAATALIASTGLAVLLGAAAERYLAALPLKLIAGAGFIVIGALLVGEHFMRAN
ncbi:MAG: TMEM165/GDT1 family protein [Amphiplicatus sp.]